MTLTQEQIKKRRLYIGASECAAALGMSRWGSPLEVWARKTGAIEEKSISNLATDIGQELEDAVCRLFTKRTGKKVRRVNQTLFHPKYDFIGCNLDRVVESEDAVLEAKTSSAWKAKEWEGEDVPKEYLLQVYHQLLVTGKKRGYLACLIGGNQHFVIKEVVYDQEIVNDIEKRLVRFWQEFVVPKVMPTASRTDKDTLDEIFPSGDEGEQVQLGDETNKLVESRNAMIQDLKNLEDQIDLAENKLKQLLGTAAIGITDRFKLSWKNMQTTRVNLDNLRLKYPNVVKECLQVSKYRRFNISKIEENKL